MDFVEERVQQRKMESEAQRLMALYNDAAQRYSKRADLFNAYQTDAAAERTSFFEKIAIGAGATIAATVSFLGTKSHSLEPRWALRASLITLAFVMFTALLRNFLYPFYLFAARQLEWFKAYREKERCKAQYITGTAINLDLDTGKPIDAKQFAIDWEKSDKDSADSIEKVAKRLDLYLKGWTYSERACLIALVVAVVCLVLLTWWNF